MKRKYDVYTKKTTTIHKLPIEIRQELVNRLSNRDFRNCILSSNKVFPKKKFAVKENRYYELRKRGFDDAAEIGDLKGVKFLHSINAPFTDDAMDYASKNGHLEIIKFLNSIDTFTDNAIDWTSGLFLKY